MCLFAVPIESILIPVQVQHVHYGADNLAGMVIERVSFDVATAAFAADTAADASEHSDEVDEPSRASSGTARPAVSAAVPRRGRTKAVNAVTVLSEGDEVGLDPAGGPARVEVTRAAGKRVATRINLSARTWR